MPLIENPQKLGSWDDMDVRLLRNLEDIITLYRLENILLDMVNDDCCTVEDVFRQLLDLTAHLKKNVGDEELTVNDRAAWERIEAGWRPRPAAGGTTAGK